MKQPSNSEDNFQLHDRLSAAELQSMAMRQQQQIDTQHQMLAAKEQRLRFLKSQETRSAVSIAEAERLRRLRERVEAQESKLRRLRALRGQVDLQKTYNVTLGNDLDSIRALFSEKEKELTLAVAKVEALTRQLEELRRDRRGGGNGPNAIAFNLNQNSPNGNASSAAKELEKLRLELAYRNQLSMQQNARLSMQREALQQRQMELHSVDKRIIELQSRINKKRIMNVQHYKTNTSNNGSGPLTNKQAPSNANLPLHTRRELELMAQTQDYEMKHHVHSSPGYDSENAHTVIGGRDGLSGDVEMDTPTGMDTDLTQPVAGSKGNHQKANTNVLGPRNTNLQDDPNTQTQPKLPSKPAYNFLQNIPLGNLVVPPRKPVNSVAPTLAMKSGSTTGSSASSASNEPSTGAKVTSVTRKMPAGASIGNGPPFIDNDKAPPANPNSGNNRPALPPKPYKQVGSGTAGGVGNNNNLNEEHGSETTMQSTPTTTTTTTTGVENDAVSSYDMPDVSLLATINKQSFANDKLPIKAKPLTIRKHPFLEQPKLKSLTGSNANSTGTSGGSASGGKVPNTASMMQYQQGKRKDTGTGSDGTANESTTVQHSHEEHDAYHEQISASVGGASGGDNGVGRGDHPIDRLKKLKSNSNSAGGDSENEVTRRKRNFVAATTDGLGSVGHGRASTVATDGSGNGSSATEGVKHKLSRRVSFDPLALLLDASLEGELELVEKTAMQVTNPSAANDEGITALHNAICAGHFEIVKFLVKFGCDVNAQDSDGWTPLHCAASCNNLPMVKFLVESGACLFAATLSDHETPAEKCEEDEEGFDGCSEYLYSIQEKLGILNTGEVYAVFSYESQQPDELSFYVNDKLVIIRKGDEAEREWWWARDSTGREGYVPRNLLGLHPRLAPMYMDENN
uniref:Uncharacterized protein n=1 Tax=Anopheles atroparvus TaxID=41427 RepID=A0A182J9K3_ANOAO